MTERQMVKRRRDAIAGDLSAFIDGEVPSLVRGEVLASWRRTARVLSPQVSAAPVSSLNADYSPLVRAARLVEREFKSRMAGSRVVIGLADARGQMVWTVGEPKFLRLSEEGVNFRPGALWSENHIGLNAISLALTTGRPAAVWASEHWSPALHGLSCYAAPICHPQSGRRLGVLDISMAWDNDQPLAASVATLLAERLSSEIVAQSGSSVSDADELVLHVLGEQRTTLGGRAVPLTRRQTEILLLLALRPEGTGLEQLHADLYGDAPVALDTLKAEVSHLRRALDGRISRAPYRLSGHVVVDALELLTDVRQGRVVQATERFVGALLPWSDSPRVVRLARTVEAALRDAVLAASDPESALALVGRLEDDAELLEHALRILPHGDARRHIMHGYLAGIELG
jgi:transcriptional regulator of acetoin/glycerol metabolism